MRLLRKIFALVASLIMIVSSFVSCALFKGDPNDRSVRYEITEDKKSVTFYASADSRAFYRWSFQNEDASVISAKTNDWTDKGIARVSLSKKITGLTAGETYIAFYIPSAAQDYTIIFGYYISVDPLGQITVEEAESDSMTGKE